MDAAALRLRRRPRQLRERLDREGGGPYGHDARRPEAGFAHRDGELKADRFRRLSTVLRAGIAVFDSHGKASGKRR